MPLEIPRRRFAVGTYESPSAQVIGEFYGLSGTMDTSGMGSAEADLELFYSADGGTTWIAGGAVAGIRAGGAAEPFRFRTEVRRWGEKQEDGHRYLEDIPPRAIDPLVKARLTTRGSAFFASFTVNEDVQRPTVNRTLRRSIAIEQVAFGESGAGQAVTTGAIDTTTGNLLITQFRWGATFTSIADNNSQTWTTNSIADGTGPSSTERYIIGDDFTGRTGHTFTGTESNFGNPKKIVAIEVLDADPTAPLDDTSIGTQAFGTSHPTGTDATSTQAATLALATFNIQNAAGTLTLPGSPWSAISTDVDPTADERLGILEQTLSSIDTPSGTATTGANNVSRNWVTIWKQAAGVAALTGTATASITEADIVAGGKTVVATLTNDTYVANSTIPVSFTTSNTLNSGSNTASTVWLVSTQAVSTNDLAIWHIGWDDSTAVTSVTASTAPDGGAISTLSGPITDSGTTIRSQVYWKIATTSWAATTVRFTPSASEQRTAVVLRILAGQFDSTTPFGNLSTYVANLSSATTVSSPSFTAASSDALGRLVAFQTIDEDPITAVPAGWVSTNALDLGAVTHGLSYRTSTVAASESIPSYSWTIAEDTSVTHAYILRPYTVATFDNARQAFINGFDSAQAEGTGWDAEVKAKAAVTEVVRTSDTVVTWTIGAQAAYNITAQETITGTIPAAILTGGAPIVATPTFTIDQVGAGGDELRILFSVQMSGMGPGGVVGHNRLN